MAHTFRLSKSKIIAGVQCPRRLWYEVHRPELAVHDAAVKRRFAGGHDVGALARRLFPGGVLVESQGNLSRAVRQTQVVLAGRRDTIVFEGAFRHRDVLVRADVITRVEGHCRLIEVKSATRVKPYHVDDAAIQAWVISGAGLPLAAVAVAHIDTAWVYGGDGNYRGLLREVDVTAAIQPRLHELPALVRGLQAMVAGRCPVVATGEQCHRPFDCPFLAVCAEGERVARPRVDLVAAPVGDADRRAAAVAESSRPPARVIVAELPYPRAFLALSVLDEAIPLWAGTRPYERFPFQWSCHWRLQSGGELLHADFLASGDEAPRRPFIESLLALLDPVTSADLGAAAIVVNDPLSATCLRDLASQLPDAAPAVLALAARLVDLRLPVSPEDAREGGSLGGEVPLSRELLPVVGDWAGCAGAAQSVDRDFARQAFLELLGQTALSAEGRPADPLTPASLSSQLSFAPVAASLEQRQTDLRDSLRTWCWRQSRALVDLVDSLESHPSA
ncbi:MAG: DUF2779 domain-containing protein [Thermoleophilia bacterium]